MFCIINYELTTIIFLNMNCISDEILYKHTYGNCLTKTSEIIPLFVL